MTELEKIKRAKMFMDKLSEGYDPIKDEEVEDSIIGEEAFRNCFTYVSRILQRVIDNNGVIGEQLRTRPFVIETEQMDRIEVSDRPVGVSELVKRINSVIDRDVIPVSNYAVNRWLSAQGLITQKEGSRGIISTPAGEEMGIITVTRSSFDGREYRQNQYDLEMQRLVISHITEIMEANQMENEK